MKFILFLIIIVFIIVVPFVVYLWHQNRSSELLNERILSAIGVALFGILTTLFFSLKSENIDQKFASTVFFHKIDKKPLADYLQGDSTLRFGGSQFMGRIEQFINMQIENNEDLKTAVFNKDRDLIEDFYHNMIIFKLLDQFFWMYSGRWDATIFSVRRGTGVSKETYIDSEMQPPNYESLNWADLCKGINQKNMNNIFSDFSNSTSFKEMKIPHNTKISFIIEKGKKGIILKNPFVDITITILLTGGSLGIGDYKWLLNFENNKNEDFWSIHFRVNCNATFAKLKYGHPDMPKYKQWVDVMFSEIQYLLDEKEQLKRAQEYRDLVRE